MTVSTRLYRNGRLEAEGFDVSEVSEHLAHPDSLVWVDLIRPEPGVLQRLGDQLGLHELAVEDAVKARQRPKFDIRHERALPRIRRHVGRRRLGAAHGRPVGLALRPVQVPRLALGCLRTAGRH